MTGALKHKSRTTISSQLQNENPTVTPALWASGQMIFSVQDIKFLTSVLGVFTWMLPLIGMKTHFV